MSQGLAAGPTGCMAAEWFTVPPSGPTLRAVGQNVVVCLHPSAVPHPTRRFVFPPSHSCRPVHICLKKKRKINEKNRQLNRFHLRRNQSVSGWLYNRIVGLKHGMFIKAGYVTFPVIALQIFHSEAREIRKTP